MSKKFIFVAAKPGSPLTPGVKAGDYIFVSGQTGGVDDKGTEVKGIEVQTRLCLDRVKEVLQADGSSLDDVVKVTVFLTDASNFNKMNEVYRTYFPENAPARSAVITGLARPGMLVEVECIAYCP